MSENVKNIGYATSKVQDDVLKKKKKKNSPRPTDVFHVILYFMHNRVKKCLKKLGTVPSTEMDQSYTQSR